jgi:Flp pilus assembly protein TadD
MSGGPSPDLAETLRISADLQADGRVEEALALLSDARRRYPADGSLAFALGNLARDLGQSEGAEQFFRQALKSAPGDFRILNNLADAQRDRGRLAQAEATIVTALDTGAGQPDLWNTAGLVALDRGDMALAGDRVDHALALDPSHAEALGTRGEIAARAGRHREAVDWLTRAVAQPGAPAQLTINLAYSLFALGRLAEAWERYAVRFETWRSRIGGGAQRRPFEQPVWRGDSLAGPLLVWGEQGVGDELLYASMLPDLQTRSAETLLETAPRLVPLLQRSFPDIAVIGRDDPPDPRTAAAVAQIPIADVGALLRPNLSSFPATAGYLRADSTLVERLRARYHAAGPRPLVGISWRSKRPKLGDHKSVALVDWAPILQSRDATFVSLQYGDCQAEIAEVATRTGVRVIEDDDIDPMTDLDAFAAQTTAMDLVITVSNTTAHMAGALGRPVWTLLANGPGLLWYWFDGRKDSPWYPSMRIFRQPEPGQWSPVIAAIAAELVVAPL